MANRIKEIFKYKINQREYAYLLVMLSVALCYCFSFLYGFFGLLGFFDTPASVILKSCFFAILTVIILLAFPYIALLRVNDTKISKWTLFLVLFPYINAFYSLFLLFVPSLYNTGNENLKTHVAELCLLVLVMHIILYGIKSSLNCVFLLLIILGVLFIFDILITRIVRFLKKFLYKKS